MTRRSKQQAASLQAPAVTAHSHVHTTESHGRQRHLLRLHILLAWLAILIASCRSSGSVERAPISESFRPISRLTNSSTTTMLPWVVALRIPTSPTTEALCTASVLTPHWLLTAAHCVKSWTRHQRISAQVQMVTKSGSTSEIYKGTARVYYHTHYQGDVENDIGLVYLEQAPIDISKTGTARLWGYDSPWASSMESDRKMTVVGWGLGDPDCKAGTSAKRVGTGFLIEKASRTALSVEADYGRTHTCGGDSGAPWLLERGGVYSIVAVHSGRRLGWDLDWEQEAVLVPPKRQWMFDESYLWAPLYLTCGIECTEKPVPPPSPPPRGTACPSGRHCCEPNPDGGSCLSCIPNRYECP